jgi:hypothetical protein
MNAVTDMIFKAGSQGWLQTLISEDCGGQDHPCPYLPVVWFQIIQACKNVQNRFTVSGHGCLVEKCFTQIGNPFLEKGNKFSSRNAL